MEKLQTKVPDELIPITFEEDDESQELYENENSFSAFPFQKEGKALESKSSTLSSSTEKLDENLKNLAITNSTDETPPTPLTFVQILKLLLEKDRELLGKMNEMIEQIEKHRKNLLIAKTTGVSVAGVGTGVLIGCVIAAPFTLGLSLVPATIFGGTCAVSGALTSAGSDIADAVITKKYENILKVLQDERNALALELGKFTTNINCIVHKLVEWGYEKEVAIVEVFRCIKNNNINLSSETDVEDEARLISSKIVGADKNLKATSADCSLDSQANLKLAGGIVGASAGVGRIVMSVTPIDKVVNIFFKTGTMIGQGVLQGVGVVVGVAFTVVDIVSVVRNWKSDHPLVPHLKTIIEALKESEEEWMSMLDLLEDHL